MSELPAHSKLGASSSHRWFNCPKSVALIAQTTGEKETSEHAERGTYAHDIASKCLIEETDAWEHSEGNKLFDKDDAEAVQVYLDAIRKEVKELNKPVILVEERFHLEDVHKDFFGTTDCTLIGEKQAQVWDYKHGIGIVVEAKRNSQLMQYAVGALHDSEKWAHDDFPVELNICQPRAFHPEGAIRSWWTTVGALKAWLQDEWIVAAKRTEDPAATLNPGPWCNKTFCPARLTCLAVRKLVEETRATTEEDIRAMEDWELGLFRQDLEVCVGLKRTADDEIFTRLSKGKDVSGWKLVDKRADRVFKETREVEIDGKKVTITLVADAKENFGDEAYEAPKLKSPAQMGKLPGGAPFVAKWAFKPEVGKTVAAVDDARKGEKGRSAKEVFAGVLTA